MKIILDSKNDYLIEAKGNQPKLLQQLKDIVADNTPLDTCLTQEKNRGRKENRYHEIYDALEGIPECWEGVKSVIYVHRYGHRPDKKTNEGNYSEHHYYISSCSFKDAKKVTKGIRQHWGVQDKFLILF